MFFLSANIKRSGGFSLVVILCGAVMAPFGHNLSHIRPLEHVHGATAEGVESGSTGMSTGFLVEEQTPLHFFECDLCAFRSLTAPVLDQPRAPLLPIRVAVHTLRAAPSARSLFYRPIRAPPVVS